MCGTDFNFDGISLSSKGFIICEFEAPSGAQVRDNGSQIVFETVSSNNGTKNHLIHTKFEDCVAYDFDICKNPDMFDDLEISEGEYRSLMRWLNVKDFKPFYFVDLGIALFDSSIFESSAITSEDLQNALSVCYYNGSFNIESIKVGGVLYGLRLHLTTDSPFGFGGEISQEVSFLSLTTKQHIGVMSDDHGYIYPDMEITCKASGILTITNETVGKSMTIKGCTNGETITIHGDSFLIETSSLSHNICDDFDYNFLPIDTLGSLTGGNTNTFSTTSPCTITFKYRPVIKKVPFSNIRIGDIITVNPDGVVSASIDASYIGAIPLAQKGAANGIASLDSSGKIHSSQLPSYVNDVIEGYYYNGAFYSQASHTNRISGESGKIYVDIHTNALYRFGGSAFIKIASAGSTESTDTGGQSGANGQDGKSAYQIAVENGYSGTVSEWLNSLKGTDGQNGADGQNGKSAYELAVENGYSGSVSQWLLSLKGADGQNGTNGTNGKSAYEIAVDNGFSGTETQWLDSLSGDMSEFENTLGDISSLLDNINGEAV